MVISKAILSTVAHLAYCEIQKTEHEEDPSLDADLGLMTLLESKQFKKRFKIEELHVDDESNEESAFRNGFSLGANLIQAIDAAIITHGLDPKVSAKAIEAAIASECARYRHFNPLKSDAAA